MEYIRDVVVLGEPTMRFTDKDVKSVQITGGFSISNSNKIFYWFNGNSIKEMHWSDYWS